MPPKRKITQRLSSSSQNTMTPKSRQPVQVNTRIQLSKKQPAIQSPTANESFHDLRTDESDVDMLATQKIENRTLESVNVFYNPHYVQV